MKNFTEDDYEKAIPACCTLKTVEEHRSIMYCWGLLEELEQGIERTDCPVTCESNINFDAEELKRVLQELRDK